MGLLVLSLFWGIGRNFDASNLYNQGACLAMWVILPAFGASTCAWRTRANEFVGLLTRRIAPAASHRHPGARA